MDTEVVDPGRPVLVTRDEERAPHGGGCSQDGVDVEAEQPWAPPFECRHERVRGRPGELVAHVVLRRVASGVDEHLPECHRPVVERLQDGTDRAARAQPSHQLAGRAVPRLDDRRPGDPGEEFVGAQLAGSYDGGTES
ncbi:hypothetical protein [Curtobacterium sp. MCJR17_043]|uniref:hypothetical protein n=1 Tax=Curtobacterium sp. MCJR17_043 TaxID=2175660 RepID=UPI0024DFA646|nr:hypothetical protein [Curtobacterium sp. MCJR17_043]WIB35183.1 hypothetical protein DEJ15_12465 [Curtobacterium sp. MCJR17_043]